MSIGMHSEDVEREIEIGIIRAFGWAVIEFEAVLFQKFLHMSALSSLMTEDMFRKYLRDMEAKGYASPVEFQGKKAWKRLVIESDIEEEELTPDEVRELLERAKIAEDEKRVKKTLMGESVVTESRTVAESILRILEKGIPKQPSTSKRRGLTIIDYVEGMRQSLAESREDFLKYVRKNIPLVYEDMEAFVSSKGEEVVLLSLRIIESGSQAYPPQ